MLMDLWNLLIRCRQYQFYNSSIFIYNEEEAAHLLVGETHTRKLLHGTTFVYFRMFPLACAVVADSFN